MPDKLHTLVGKDVVVKTGDISYRGILIEVTEEMIFLKGTTGWRQVPVDRVVEVRAGEETSGRNNLPKSENGKAFKPGS